MVRNQPITAQQPQTDARMYTCTQCGSALFAAATKFEVGSGFPSFWQHIGQSVKQNPLSTYGRNRIQLLCATCNQHLGHLFNDKRTPTHLRYCINANALKRELIG